MDNAILTCYGWQDLDLEHGFHQNDRGQTRFTVSPEAKRELLRRLLELNLQVAEGEREGERGRKGGGEKERRKGGAGAKRASPEAAAQPGFLAQEGEAASQVGQVQAPKTDYSLYRCSICRGFVVGYDQHSHRSEKHPGQRVEYTKVG